MGIQTRDQGSLRDTITVLSGLGTPLSDLFAAGLADLVAESPAPKGPRGRPATKAEITGFRAACARELAATRRAMDVELARTTLADCLCLAIVFGQGEDGTQLGSANAFTHEMEFLASCLPRVSSPRTFSRDNLDAALRALVLSRRHGVLDGHLTLTAGWADGEISAPALGERWQAHDQLAWAWRTEHGAFPTRYDWEHSLRLAKRIRDRGGDHPDLTALLATYMFVISGWSSALREAHDAITDPALRTLLEDRTLLHLPADIGLSGQAAADLALAASRLPLPWAVWADALPEPQRREAQRWRELLTADPATLGRNTAREHVFDSPLAATPLVEVDGAVLLSLPHAICSDLSKLVERVFARSPSLPYYRARGEAVEEAALDHLSRVFTGARVLRGGSYPGHRPGELIEVDGVVVWRDVVLVVEGKGGYLSTRSRHGDPDAARTELRRTVGDGFFQVARLVRALDREGRVTLTGERGEALELERDAIRRVYAVVPTADAFDPLSTLLGPLWQRDVLPAGAFPTIMAVPQLHLVTDLLPTPLELLAYLDYREEVLAEPRLRTAGELELLGTFTATMDVIGTFAELGADSGTLGTDHQERFIDPWLVESFHTWLNDLPPVPPPRRHVEEHRARIERFAAATGDTASAVVLTQLTGAQLGVAELHAARVPRLRRGTLSPFSTQGLGVVVSSPLDPIDTVLATRPVRELRERSRWVVYLTPGADGAEFRHAERGGAHVFGRGGGSLAEESRLGAVAEWFDRAAARRHGAHRPITAADRENIRALVDAGVPETLAVGAARLGLTTAVLDLADRDPGIGLTRVADFYLTHVRKAADALGVAGTDLAFTTAAAHDVLRLVVRGRMLPDHAVTLIRLAVGEPGTPPESLARSAGLLTDEDGARVAAAVDAALGALGLTPERVRLTRGKDRRRTRDRLLGAVRGAHPDLSPLAAAEHVERLWGSPAEPR